MHTALMSVWSLISALNKYIDKTAPWELAKNRHAQARHGHVPCHGIHTVCRGAYLPGHAFHLTDDP